MKKIFRISGVVFAALIVGYLYYYITLPAFNIHSSGFWMFLIGAFAILTAIIFFSSAMKNRHDFSTGQFKAKGKLFRVSLIFTIALFAVFVIGSLLSTPVFNAKKYRELIQITERNFNEDIKEISYNEIPLLDKNSASLLGSRKMGSMVEYVSQFEVMPNYTQVNYNGKPTRVTPLGYGSFLNGYLTAVPVYRRI